MAQWHGRCGADVVLGYPVGMELQKKEAACFL
jgi:hypothetical protein